MIKYISLSSAAAIVVSIVFFTAIVSAEEIEINVRTQSEPKAALGIFFTSGKVVQQPNTSFERVNDETVVVRMPYDLSGLPSASPFATAYLLTEDNEVVFGDVRLLSAADDSQSFWRIPVCSPDGRRTATDLQMQEQLNYLESLLEIRIKRREVAQKVLAEKMTSDVTSRLQKLEKGFGLQNPYPLSPDRPGLELVERLSRLRDTITLYRNSKESEQGVPKS